MSTHGGKWYACCGVGKGWERLAAKRERQAGHREVEAGLVDAAEAEADETQRIIHAGDVRPGRRTSY